MCSVSLVIRIEDYEKRFQQLQEVISKQSFDYETLWAALGATLNPFQITKLQLLLSAMKRGDMEESTFYSLFNITFLQHNSEQPILDEPTLLT
jgi:hypothetical protein